ncbi:hypothetical protein [uncultured Dokdonia sp.]|uniref:hypothetical protein n=1 Tax=uncultured Dokdonia sp. TaxID=575653 RepID=UPI00262F5118|nr:hypothetical protein [uncultured Dokdonia sp.]
MKMKGAHFKLLILCLLVSVFANAQVGVGTITPNGKLTIDASAETTAALELVPQATPTTNLANGQLAVIGDKLYMYDLTRTAWLSVESTAIQFGRNGDVDTNALHYGGNMVANDSGALMPFNGTIVAITAMGASGDDTDFNVRVRTAAGTNSVNETFSLSGLRYIDTTTNLDFSANEHITARARDAATTTTDVTVIIWVKWRQ